MKTLNNTTFLIIRTLLVFQKKIYERYLIKIKKGIMIKPRNEYKGRLKNYNPSYDFKEIKNQFKYFKIKFIINFYS